MKLLWLLLALFLAACSGSRPAPRPPAPPAPAPVVTPTPDVLVTLCHYEAEPGGDLWQSLDLTAEQAAGHAAHPVDHPGACMGNERPLRPPRPDRPSEPDGGNPPPPQPTKPDRLTICHVADRQPGKDREQQTLSLPRERADWHLEAHRKSGDHAGPCGKRE